MNPLARIGVLGTLSVVCAAAPGAQPGGSFSRKAEPVTVGGSTASFGDRQVTIVALDRDSEDGFPAVLRVPAGPAFLEHRFDFGLNAEVLWSPDSRMFAITGSRDGAGGQYRTAVVTVTPGRLIWFDPTPAVEKAFGHPVKCGWPEAPNVGAVTWLSNTQLLVVAQIIGHSNCDSFGTFTAYLIDVKTRRIERRFGQLDAKQRWGSVLGVEPAAARDECVRRPPTCYVPANHPEMSRPIKR